MLGLVGSSCNGARKNDDSARNDDSKEARQGGEEKIVVLTIWKLEIVLQAYILKDFVNSVPEKIMIV